MGAIAGEVLADRQLEPGERGDHEAGREQPCPALAVHEEEADHEEHEAEENDQLDQRERAPRRGWALIRDRLAGRLAAGRLATGLTAVAGAAAGARGRRLRRFFAISESAVTCVAGAEAPRLKDNRTRAEPATS